MHGGGIGPDLFGIKVIIQHHILLLQGFEARIHADPYIIAGPVTGTPVISIRHISLYPYLLHDKAGELTVFCVHHHGLILRCQNCAGVFHGIGSGQGNGLLAGDQHPALHITGRDLQIPQHADQQACKIGIVAAQLVKRCNGSFFGAIIRLIGKAVADKFIYTLCCAQFVTQLLNGLIDGDLTGQGQIRLGRFGMIGRCRGGCRFWRDPDIVVGRAVGNSLRFLLFLKHGGDGLNILFGILQSGQSDSRLFRLIEGGIYIRFIRLLTAEELTVLKGLQHGSCLSKLCF